MKKHIALIIGISSFLFSQQLPEMNFKKSFYIENKCSSFHIQEDKEFNPKNCFSKKNESFNIDLCLLMDKKIMCVSGKNRKNYILKTDYIKNQNNVYLKNNIIEVFEIVYTNNPN